MEGGEVCLRRRFAALRTQKESVRPLNERFLLVKGGLNLHPRIVLRWWRR